MSALHPAARRSSTTSGAILTSSDTTRASMLTRIHVKGMVTVNGLPKVKPGSGFRDASGSKVWTAEDSLRLLSPASTSGR
jgi:hypothetical protein